MDIIAAYPPEQLYRLPLHELYERSNVPLSERDRWLLPARFHAIADEVNLLNRGSASVDFSDHGLLRLDGKEAVDFLNRVSTNDFREFSPGDSVQTVFTTEKGRVIDSVIVLHRGDHLLLIVSRGAQSAVKQWIEKFIIAEDISVADHTGKHLLFAVFHPRSVLADTMTGGSTNVFRSNYYHREVAFYVFDDLSIIPDSLRLLTDVQVGNDAFEAYCIQQGIPQCGPAVMGECNPLELNMWNQISFTKGCYIGQEVIARLDTYKKIQRTLCSFRTTGLFSQGRSPRIVYEGKNIGIITNCIQNEHNAVNAAGLAVIRKEFAVQDAEYPTADGADSIRIDHIFEHDEAADGINNHSR